MCTRVRYTEQRDFLPWLVAQWPSCSTARANLARFGGFSLTHTPHASRVGPATASVPPGAIGRVRHALASSLSSVSMLSPLRPGIDWSLHALVILSRLCGSAGRSTPGPCLAWSSLRTAISRIRGASRRNLISSAAGFVMTSGRPLVQEATPRKPSLVPLAAKETPDASVCFLARYRSQEVIEHTPWDAVGTWIQVHAVIYDAMR